MYEFMKETVIMTAFIWILGFNALAIGYWIARFIKWAKKARRRDKAEKK